MRLKFFLYLLLLSNLYCISPADNSKRITVTGTAFNAKAGAIVETASGAVYYLDGLHTWSENFYGKKVKVTGRLIIEKHERRSTDSVLVQEIVGNVRILKNPKWELAK